MNIKPPVPVRVGVSHGDLTGPESSIFTTWQRIVREIARGEAGVFLGRTKETAVFRYLRQTIEGNTQQSWRFIGPDSQARFRSWSIDVVCSADAECVAIEGKFKLRTDGAVPDNRKAAFFDLYKLEQYVASGSYSRGLFLWLTDEPAYLRVASGDSADFSTHEGRKYERGIPLNARRSRDSSMPLPLTLDRSYTFHWEKVLPDRNWFALALVVSPFPAH